MSGSVGVRTSLRCRLSHAGDFVCRYPVWLMTTFLVKFHEFGVNVSGYAKQANFGVAVAAAL